MTDPQRFVLGVHVNGEQHVIEDADSAEDFQVLMLIRAERASERGDRERAAEYQYRADEIGALWEALRQGRMLPQPTMEI